MTLKKIHIVALILAIVIASSVAVAYAIGNNESDSNYFDINMSSIRDVDVQTLVIESNTDIFKNATPGNIVVYVTGVDDFVHNEWFDSNGFSTDLYENGYYDEEYDLYISEDAVKYTGADLTVTQDGKKKITIEFDAPSSQYCVFQVEFAPDILDMEMNEGAYLDLYDVPTGSMILPVIEITGTFYECQSNPEIHLDITDGSFVENVLPEYIVLDGGFSGLTVKSIDRISDTIIIIKTDGAVPRCSGIPGKVTITADAYDAPAWITKDILATYTDIDYNTVIIDTFEMDIAGDSVVIPIYFSQSYYEKLTGGELTLGAIGTTQRVEISLTDVEEIGDDSFVGYVGSLVAPVDLLFADDYGTLLLFSDDEQIADLKTYSDSVMAFVYDVSEDEKHFKVSIVPIMMDFASGVKADNFIFPDGCTVDSFKIEDGMAYFELSVSELPEVLKYSIDVKEGTFTDLLGEPSGDMVLCVMFADDEEYVTDGTVLYGLGAEPSTDAMIKAIYSSTNFNDIYSMVELGVGVVSTILEASGLIDIPDPEQMRFEALMLQCERIQIMLADVNAKLDKVSNQIMKLDQKIDKIQMTLLRNEYGKYVEAVNNLENTSALFSKHIKTRMYNEIINGSGSFYIYLIENNKTSNKSDIFSIKHGDYSKDNTGGIIGGQKLVKTVALPIGAGTFKEASKLFKFVDGSADKKGTTAYCMIKDLTDYYTANPISGYTAQDLAKGTYKAIVYKLVELAANQEGGDGDKLINAYKQYASVAASLHNGVYDANITNYYHSGIDYIEYKYNFYSETKDILRTMNHSAAMNTFIYGAFVNVLDQLSVSSDDTLPKYMDSAIKYLKNNQGTRGSNTYSYIAHGSLSLGKMKIHSETTFKSDDKFDGNVSENIVSTSHNHTLGNDRYVNTDMINKMYQRWQALGSPNSTFAQYVTKCTGIQLGSYLMTKFDGEGDFSEGDGMYLQTAKYNVMDGNSGYRIVPTDYWFTLSGSFSAIKTYSESWSKNIKSHFSYNGEVLKLSDLSAVKVGGKSNCLYAYASLTDHRWQFVFDEAQIFSSYGYYDNDYFSYKYWSDKTYQCMWHETTLDYLKIA